MVACGGLDAYVDVRDALTPENYMASVRIIVEAGGVVSDRAGRPLAPITSMTQSQSVVAAANPTLHPQILGVLDGRCTVTGSVGFSGGRPIGSGVCPGRRAPCGSVRSG